jgi:hypothetical protein
MLTPRAAEASIAMVCGLVCIDECSFAAGQEACDAIHCPFNGLVPDSECGSLCAADCS